MFDGAEVSSRMSKLWTRQILISGSSEPIRIRMSSEFLGALCQLFRSHPSASQDDRANAIFAAEMEELFAAFWFVGVNQIQNSDEVSVQ